MLDYIRELFNYNVWAHDRIWTCVMALDDEQFVQELGYSLGSIRNQTVHVMSVERRWFARIAGTHMPVHLAAADFTTRGAVRTLWKTLEAENRPVIDGLSAESLNRSIEYDMPHRGGMKSNTVSEIIAHVVNHGTDHRAQILSMLHTLGAPTTEQDFMFYLWEPDQNG